MFASSRGSLAMKHVLDKYANMASFSEEGGVPCDEFSNTDFDNIPPMGMSPVSNLIKKMSAHKVYDSAKKTSGQESAASTPLHSANRGLRRVVLTKVGTEGTGSDGLENQPDNYRIAQPAGKSSTSAPRRYFSDVLNQMHENPDSIENAPKALLEALKRELDALGSKNQEQQAEAVRSLPEANNRTNNRQQQQPTVRLSSSATGVFANSQPPPQQKLISEVRRSNQQVEPPRVSHIHRPPVQATSLSSNIFPYSNGFASYGRADAEILTDNDSDGEEEEAVEVEGFAQLNSRNVETVSAALPPRSGRDLQRPQINRPHTADSVHQRVSAETVIPQKPRRSAAVTAARTEEEIVVPTREPSLINLSSAFPLPENPDPDKHLTVETTLPDLIKYQLQARLLEHGVQHDSEKFERATHWAYYHVATEVNACLADGFSIQYCCLKRIIAATARIAVSIFK